MNLIDIYQITQQLKKWKCIFTTIWKEMLSRTPDWNSKNSQIDINNVVDRKSQFSEIHFLR